MDETFTWDQLDALMEELRVMARTLLSHELNAESIRPSDLIASAIRRMAPAGLDWGQVTWPNRRYFLGTAYEAMQRALVDHARKRNARRRPPPGRRIQPEEIHLENLVQVAHERPDQFEALQHALERMRAQHPDWVELVNHHYYSGYTWEEIAAVMEISEKSARRWGERALLVLNREILHILNS